MGNRQVSIAFPAGKSAAPMPRYHQLYVLLKEKISSGEYSPGAMIPSELDLSSDFSVSRITVRRALDELAREGLITRQRGRGTFVSAEIASHVLTATVDEQVTNALRLGRRTRVDLLEYRFVKTAPAVSRALRVDDDELAHQTIRVRHLSGEPLSHVTVHVPTYIADLYDRSVLMTAKPIVSLVRDKGFRILAAEQVVTATLADSVVAPFLKVEIGSPLLKITRAYYGKDGEGLLHVEALYRTDRYSLRVSLTENEVSDNAFLTSLL